MQDLSEYTSGADYDAQYAGLYEREISVLKRLALRQNGPILDVGCGTGIVTIPLAETGLETVGIDVTDAMLSRAREKARGRGNLSFRLADALTFELSRRFALAVMTGNAFQEFLSEGDILALLANIRRHLCRDGRLVFDTRLPEGYDLSLDADFEFWQTYLDPSGQPVHYFDKQVHFDPSTGLLYFEMERRYADGTKRMSSNTIKFTPHDRLLALVEESGFEVVNKYKNWDLEPSEIDAANIVLELKKVE